MTFYLRAAFDIFDSDHNGLINEDKLRQICQALGATQTSKETLNDLFSEADREGGSMDFKGFCDMVEKTGSVFGLFDVTKVEAVKKILGDGPSPFETALVEHFPGSMQELDYVEKLADVAEKFGFRSGTCISCVSLCRDEITAPLRQKLQAKFNQSFTFSSLGGFLTCGKTGFGAAHAHAPIVDGREKYLYVTMPHIALDAFGKVGAVRRPGRAQDSGACGALMAFHSELASGSMNLGEDSDDM
jgi:hypothetical protein